MIFAESRAERIVTSRMGCTWVSSAHQIGRADDTTHCDTTIAMDALIKDRSHCDDIPLDEAALDIDSQLQSMSFDGLLATVVPPPPAPSLDIFSVDDAPDESGDTFEMSAADWARIDTVVSDTWAPAVALSETLLADRASAEADVPIGGSHKHTKEMSLVWVSSRLSLSDNVDGLTGTTIHDNTTLPGESTCVVSVDVTVIM